MIKGFSRKTWVSRSETKTLILIHNRNFHREREQREREMFMPHAYRSKPSHCLSLSLSYSHTQTPIYSHHTHNKAQKLCGIKGGVVSILQLIHNSKSVNHAPELHSSWSHVKITEFTLYKLFGVLRCVSMQR